MKLIYNHLWEIKFNCLVKLCLIRVDIYMYIYNFQINAVSVCLCVNLWGRMQVNFKARRGHQIPRNSKMNSPLQEHEALLIIGWLLQFLIQIIEKRSPLNTQCPWFFWKQSYLGQTFVSKIYLWSKSINKHIIWLLSIFTIAVYKHVQILKTLKMLTINLPIFAYHIICFLDHFKFTQGEMAKLT